ncbi:hypothetical protein BDP27DRAFT_1364294 [Rhodocollybia butyracea]|uniref:Uncharacterized protein n=1 Tax=Rhodocollybia butyracea TaxID=206335 RepID=A0A9P5PLP1_9AGAR|nr:hypothetical protein BDP27DRAFT_1364294 [Rhodocollybia butyracea]
MANFSDETDLTLSAFIDENTPLDPGEIEWKARDFLDERSLCAFLQRIAKAFELYFVTGKEFVTTEWRKPASAIRAFRKLKDLPEHLQPSLEPAIRITKLATILVKVMNTIQLEFDPVLAERFATHRWSYSIAVELQRYTQK